MIGSLSLAVWQVKNPGPEDQALFIPRGDLLYWKFIDLLKFQLTNPKKQTNKNDQNLKSQTLEFGFWDLFGPILRLGGAWNLLFETPNSKAEPKNSDSRNAGSSTVPKDQVFQGKINVEFILSLPKGSEAGWVYPEPAVGQKRRETPKYYL